MVRVGLHKSASYNSHIAPFDIFFRHILISLHVMEWCLFFYVNGRLLIHRQSRLSCILFILFRVISTYNANASDIYALNDNVLLTYLPLSSPNKCIF